MTYEIVIPGVPVSKSRPRVTKHGAYTPTRTKNHEILIKTLFVLKYGKPLLTGAIKADIEARFPLGASSDLKKDGEPNKKGRRKLDGYHIIPPDGDNIQKLIFDALNGIAYKDDAQVADIHCRKVYALTAETVITLTELKEGKEESL